MNNRFDGDQNRIGQGGWLEMRGSPGQVMVENNQYWECRIAVKPDLENLKKAHAIIENLMAQKKYRNAHPGLKMYAGGGYWDALENPKQGVAIADRDQLGKEICIFMEYDDAKKKFEFTPEQYKSLMLDLWKALKDGGVELGYVTPGKDEKTIDCEQGIITPFCYSAGKPYNGRHGILNATSYNPNNYDDPLNGVKITPADLKKHKITYKKDDFNQMLVNRIEYQRQRYTNASNSIKQNIDAEKFRIDAAEQTPYEKAMEIIDKFINVKNDEDLQVLKQQYLVDQTDWLNHLPGRSNQHLSSHLPEARILNRFDRENIVREFGKAKNEILVEVDAIKKEYAEVTSSSSQFRVSPEQIARSPLFFQGEYRRLVHLKNLSNKIAADAVKLGNNAPKVTTADKTTKMSTAKTVVSEPKAAAPDPENDRQPFFVTYNSNKPTADFTPPNSETDDYDRVYKIRLAGDRRAGKSCLLLRYVDDTYTDSFISSIGTPFKIKTLGIDNSTVKTQIWDPENDRFKSVDNSRSRVGNHAVMYVFDVTDRNSFSHIKGYLEYEYQKSGDSKPNIVLVGTKCDDVNQRVVSEDEVKKLITQVNNEGQFKIDGYVETSAKTGKNADLAFQLTAQAVHLRLKNRLEKTNTQADNSKLSPKDELIADLQKYVKYIDELKSKKDGLASGFKLFKNSRKTNREANYLLAKQLIRELGASKKSNESIDSVFTKIDDKRDKIIADNNMNVRRDFKNRGINSKRLNKVLDKAKRFSEAEPKQEAQLSSKSKL